MGPELLEEAGLRLDHEIEETQQRVEDLKDQLRKQATTFYSAQFALLQRQKPTWARGGGRAASKKQQAREEVQARIQAQHAHDQQCLYRLGASVTSFKVRDPDPNAVDGGTVLGLRFEVMTGARYLHPYFVFLNRPWANNKTFLRVHRHTVPPCIPLSGLAARHLPNPKPINEEVVEEDWPEQPTQDLLQFVRTLRREIVRYHNRLGAMADIRRAVGLAPRKEGEGEPAAPRTTSIIDVRAVDPEAKQIRIEWSDGRSGRIVVDNDGKVARLVVFGERGRDRETARELFSETLRLEDVAGKLTSLAEKESEVTTLGDGTSVQSEMSEAS